MGTATLFPFSFPFIFSTHCLVAKKTHQKIQNQSKWKVKRVRVRNGEAKGENPIFTLSRQFLRNNIPPFHQRHSQDRSQNEIKRVIDNRNLSIYIYLL